MVYKSNVLKMCCGVHKSVRAAINRGRLLGNERRSGYKYFYIFGRADRRIVIRAMKVKFTIIRNMK